MQSTALWRIRGLRLTNANFDDLQGMARARQIKLFPPSPVTYPAGMDEPVPLPIDGVLDLHTFRPQDVKTLVPDYLAACQEKNLLLVRIIHGKGIGQLRQTVHALLRRQPEVLSFTLDHPEYGGWGATLVRLKPRGPEAEPKPAPSRD